jgi:hypothetical protein
MHVDTTTVNYPVLTKLKGAVLILEAAASEGLPLPVGVNVWGHDEVVKFQVGGTESKAVAALGEWAEWLGIPVTRRHFNTENQWLEVHAELYDVSFVAWTLVAVKQPAAVA